MVSCVDAKDFSFASFKVAISRIQQEALNQANARVPGPAHQLELLNSKKTKSDKMRLGLQHKIYQLHVCTKCFGNPSYTDLKPYSN